MALREPSRPSEPDWNFIDIQPHEVCIYLVLSLFIMKAAIVGLPEL